MKHIYFTILFFFTFNSYAADIACAGKVTWILADHAACTDEHNKKQFAFKVDTASGLWKCTNSDAASSLILAAKFENKTLSVYMSDEDGATCNSHAQHIKPSYIFIQ
jgi:hypothetical protein